MLRVFTFTLTHFLAKTIFPEGMVISVVKKWKFQGGGGEAYVKFPPWWGYGYFLELHNVKMSKVALSLDLCLIRGKERKSSLGG